MRKLGTIDLEILHLAINKDDTFDETDLEKSELRRLGVGRILDSLATLKDRKMLSLNRDGSFTITEFAREILWSKKNANMGQNTAAIADKIMQYQTDIRHSQNISR